MPDHTSHIPQVEEYYDGLYVLNGAVMDKDSYEKHTAAASATSPEADTSAPAASPEVDTAAPAASPEAHDAAASDPFSAPQDFRQMAAQAFESDRQAEYRPETAVFVPYTVEDREYYEYVPTGETFCEDGFRILLGAPMLVRCGSGSYRTSGSYRLSSGSYRLSSGSYRLISGSYRITSGFYRLSSGRHQHEHEYEYRVSSGSFRRSSGSFRLLSSSFRRLSGSFHRSSGSFRLTSGSYRLSPDSFCMPEQAEPVPGDTFCPQEALEVADKPYMGSFLWGMDAGGYGLNLI